MNQNINKELRELLNNPRVFDLLFNDVDNDDISDLIGYYTKARDFIEDDKWMYRLYFSKWNEYVNIHTDYSPVIDALIYFIDDEQIPF